MKNINFILIAILCIIFTFCKGETPVENNDIHLPTEDIIYVEENEYYYRDENGNSTQITFSNDFIENQIEFYKDRSKFLYTSQSSSGTYKINEIDLNSLSHKILYETEELFCFK